MSRDLRELRNRAASGIKWVFVGRFIERLMRFGTMVVLSRLLMPDEFGLFVLGLSIAGAVTYIRSFGIDAAMIQRDDTDDRAVSNTAFVILALGGVVLYALFYAVAPWITRFFANPPLLPVIRTVGISIMIGAIAKVPQALTEKSLKFHRIAIAEIVGRIGFTVTAIALAFAGAGVWSLVSGYLVRQLITSSAIWAASGWHPGRSYDRQIAGELVGYGRYIVGSSLLRYLQSNLDKMAVGRLAGSGALGLYGLAFNVANLANAQMVQPLRQVMFPTYSHLQGNVPALKSAFVKSVKYIFFVGAPLCVGLVLLAPEFITVVYTERWLGAATAMQILACYGLIRSVSDSVIPLLRAIGLPRTDFKLMLLHVILIGVLIVPAVAAAGIVGAALAMVISGGAVFGYMIRSLRDAIDVSARDLAKAVAPGCMSALIMGLPLLGLKLKVDLLATPIGGWALPIAIAGGGIVYLVCLWVVERDELMTLKSLLTTRMGSG